MDLILPNGMMLWVRDEFIATVRDATDYERKHEKAETRVSLSSTEVIFTKTPADQIKRPGK